MVAGSVKIVPAQVAYEYNGTNSAEIMAAFDPTVITEWQMELTSADETSMVLALVEPGGGTPFTLTAQVGDLVAPEGPTVITAANAAANYIVV